MQGKRKQNLELLIINRLIINRLIINGLILELLPIMIIFLILDNLKTPPEAATLSLGNVAKIKGIKGIKEIKERRESSQLK